MIKVVFAVTEVGDTAAAGDYFTALELGTALQQRFGWQVEYRPKGESWYKVEEAHLLIVMLAEYELPLIQQSSLNLIKIGWARNWFEKWAGLPWLDQYDLMLASSISGMRYLSERSGKLASLLRIATNPERFPGKGPSQKPRWDIVFTGS